MLAEPRRAADALIRWFHAQLARGVDREVARRGLLGAAVGLFERDLGVSLGCAWPGGAIGACEAAACDWSKFPPELIGALYEHSLATDARHAGGVHFTAHAEILDRILGPTIVAPWLTWIERSNRSPGELHARLLRYRVLDPACGSGNFLVAAYRALRAIEARLRGRGEIGARSVEPGQLLGIDRDPVAVEVARLALRIVHRQADGGATRSSAGLIVGDALFDPWPHADVIVGNPPFLDARKLTVELGRDYAARLRAAYPQIPGRADLCVYWFRRAHDGLATYVEEDPVAGRAGLVGTKTVRENYSREGGLDAIVGTGGVIVDAIASLAWPGAAAVDVAIVNWVKGPYDGPRWLQDVGGERREVAGITSALTAGVDVAGARALKIVTRSKRCFEGQQPGHPGFRLDEAQRRALAARDPRLGEVVHPYMNGVSLLTGGHAHAPVFIVDMGERSLAEAAVHPDALAHLERTVLPAWSADARREGQERGAGEHQRRVKLWWQLKRRRPEMLAAIAGLPRYVVCVRHTMRPIFEFLDRAIRPDSALTVFAFADDYSFGVLQSSMHWQWFMARCSSLSQRHRYTSETVFDAFPWPQRATAADMVRVAEEARALRAVRRAWIAGGGLRALYRQCDADPGHPLRAAHAALDAAVLRAYGFAGEVPLLAALLELNREVAALGDRAVAPGGPAALVSDDRVASV